MNPRGHLYASGVSEEVTTQEDESRAHTRGWSGNDGLALFALTAIAGLLRIFRLGVPDRYIFDETYYAKEACKYIGRSDDLCNVSKTPPAEVHPPLGKWLLGTGIDVFGYDAFGWRIGAAVFGIIGVVLLYLLARKLFHSTLAAVVAAGLLAFDPLNFVQSRTALLDIFPATFGVAAFLFLLYDKDRMQKHPSSEEPRSGLLARPWRLAAGLAAGAATASKWSGGLVLIGVIVLTILWEVARRRREESWVRALLSTLRRESLTIVLFLGLVPFIVYVASYIGRLEGPVLTPLAEGSWAREWLRYQTNAFTFHRGLRSHHGYESPPITWIALKRPLLYLKTESSSERASVYAMGNPLIWWPSIVALGYLFIRWIRTRDWRQPEGLILLGFASTYLTWVVLAPSRPAVFLFYMLPAIPFMCLAVAHVVGVLARGTTKKVLVAVAAVFSVGWFFLYYPIIADVPISKERWDAQMVFQDCHVPSRRDIETHTVTQAINKQTTIIKTNLRTETSTKHIPPPGWCWN